MGRNNYISLDPREIAYTDLRSRVKDAIDLAVVQARKSNGGYRHGSVLFRGPRVLGLGHNELRHVSWVTSLPGDAGDTNLTDWNVHAEVSCLHNVRKDLTAGADMVVVRIGRSGAIRLSQPCSRCLRTVTRQGVRRVYYSITEDLYGRIDLAALDLPRGGRSRGSGSPLD